MRFFYILFSFLFLHQAGFPQDTLTVKNVDAILYTGNNLKQPLVVGLGGSEGGNAWASSYWKKVRDQFLEEGYSFLAVDYFKTENSPELLEKIGIDNVYAVISEAKKNTKVDSTKIAIIGGSRGADLALLIGSYYADINCVVGLSSSHVAFTGILSIFPFPAGLIKEKNFLLFL